MTETSKALTKREVKERMFIAAYKAKPNATEAAIKAGYSAKTAAAAGSRLLKKVKISGAIQQSAVETLDKLEISTQRILQERARLALYDIGDAAGAKISGPQDIANLPDHIRQAVTGWKWDKQGNFVLTFADKNPHLTAIEKINGLYAPDEKGEGALSIHIHL